MLFPKLRDIVSGHEFDAICCPTGPGPLVSATEYLQPVTALQRGCYMSAAPDTSRSISKMRRNITSLMRRNSRMPIQVPTSTAGAHQRNVFPVSTSKSRVSRNTQGVATCMIRMNG